MTTAAQADTVSKSWQGPRGGEVHYNGAFGPNAYRGAVTVQTPNRETYRRVTKGVRGPEGAHVSRRWVGPDGAAVRRRGFRR